MMYLLLAVGSVLLHLSVAQTLNFPSPPVLVGSSSNAQSHFWFPQTYASYGDGETLLVQVQLMDDGGDCHPTSDCSHCHKPAPCQTDTRYTPVLSVNQSSTWQVPAPIPVSPDYALTLGGFQLNPWEHMSVKVTKDASSGAIAGKGLKLFLDPSTSKFSPATSSHSVVFAGLPPDVAAAAIELIRWCDPVFIPELGVTAEVIQVEMPPTPSMAHPRALTLFTSSDNFTFTYQSTLANHSWPMFSHFDNGPCEAGLAYAGAFLVVFRVDSFVPYFHTMSTDGKTWTTPTQLPGAMGSVRPRLQLVRNPSPAVLLVTGRPGLSLTVATPHVSPSDGSVSSFSWNVTNLAAIHNSLLPSNPDYHYPPVVVNRTVEKDFSLHGTTAYTTFTPVPSNSSSTAARFTVVYDRLAHGLG